ncbi:protein stunted-like [Plutella xylostella]|uniref:protein stunted-like n=1 Tax=Plutella xylostella TaxID=51655 RepID=UPI002032F905|nr:protein stunted-like [Plutella xylostella]
MSASNWRSAGLNYINFSNIAARTLRKSLKAEFREDAAKRDISAVRVFFYVNGEILPLGEKPPAEKKDAAAVAVKV